MKSLLNALQEGRLVELPVSDKEKALEYLALLMEAIPDISTRQDLVAAIKKRESSTSTAIGMGIACPHFRTSDEGELFCAVGWSPQGIDFNAADGKKVHLMVMYYIPESQRNSYLKEVSGLAKAVQETDAFKIISSAPDLQTIRNELLDWVELAIDKAIPDSKARMIKLEEKHAQALQQNTGGVSGLAIRSFAVVFTDPVNHIVLSHEDDRILESFEQKFSIEKLMAAMKEPINIDGLIVKVLSSESYLKNRMLFRCIAVEPGLFIKK